MTAVVKKAQPACIALLRQATVKWPKRSKKSDGLLPSAAHIKQSPNSDHNTGFGVDLTTIRSTDQIVLSCLRHLEMILGLSI